jgi:3-methyladenine DNA glycosylase Mpg
VPESGRTPKQKPDSWYNRPTNADAFVTERRNNCTGVLVRAVNAKDRMDRTSRETSLTIIDATTRSPSRVHGLSSLAAR